MNDIGCVLCLRVDRRQQEAGQQQEQTGGWQLADCAWRGRCGHVSGGHVVSPLRVLTGGQRSSASSTPTCTNSLHSLQLIICSTFTGQLLNKSLEMLRSHKNRLFDWKGNESCRDFWQFGALTFETAVADRRTDWPSELIVESRILNKDNARLGRTSFSYNPWFGWSLKR